MFKTDTFWIIKELRTLKIRRNINFIKENISTNYYQGLNIQNIYNVEASNNYLIKAIVHFNFEFINMISRFVF